MRDRTLKVILLLACVFSVHSLQHSGETNVAPESNPSLLSVAFDGELYEEAGGSEHLQQDEQTRTKPSLSEREAGSEHQIQKKCESPLLKSASTSPDFPVDVVYTWIAQPSQEEFVHIIKDCPHLQGGWQRMRNLHTLRFSLRMLEQNIPWVRTVFIVTGHQVPDWLNASNPRVQVIKQQDLWPKDRLHRDKPIHNSQSVEAHLHRIPGLAKNFIYFNDDMFVGRALERSFFFTDAGAPVMHAGRRWDHDADWCHYEAPGSLPMDANTHQCISLTIPMIEDVQKRWPATFDNISSAHCRGDLPIDQGPSWLYGWYGIQSGLTETRKEARVAWMQGSTAHHRIAWYQEQLQHPPDIGCINDDFDVGDESIFIRETNSLINFMDSFSNAQISQFEKHGQWVAFPGMSLL